MWKQNKKGNYKEKFDDKKIDSKGGNYDESFDARSIGELRKPGAGQKALRDIRPSLKVNGGMAAPATSWLFNVKFFLNDDAAAEYGLRDDNVNESFVCISTDLPRMEAATKDLYFFGTKKSFVISRDYSCDLSMEFWMRDGSKIDNKSKTNNTDLIEYIKGDMLSTRPESMNHQEFVNHFNKIEIEVLNMDGSLFKTYTIFEPKVTGFEHSTSLSYDGEDGMKLSMTIHTDYWTES